MKRALLSLIGCEIGGVIIGKNNFLYEDKLYTARWRMGIATAYYDLLKQKIQQGDIIEDEFWAERIAQAKKAVELAATRYNKVVATQHP